MTFQNACCVQRLGAVRDDDVITLDQFLYNGLQVDLKLHDVIKSLEVLNIIIYRLFVHLAGESDHDLL